MKCVVLNGNQKIGVEERPVPLTRPDECHVRVVSVGVCSSDVVRSFENGAYFYPLIMGHEISGEVIEVGENVKKFHAGDRVAVFPLIPCFNCEACEREMYAQCHDYNYFGSRTNGGYAEYLSVPEWNLLKLPVDVSFQDAALIEPLSVVVHALKRINLTKSNKKPTPGSTVVIGAGFLGLLAVQILRMKFPDMELSIIDRNSFKLDKAEMYANKIIQLDNSDEWSEFLSNHFFQNVIEVSGSPDAFRYSISLAANEGKILWIGNITGELNIPKELVSVVLRKELSIMGSWNSTYSTHKSNDWKESLELIQNGIRPSKLVTHWISLDETPETLKKLHDHKKRKTTFDSVKVMINNWSE